MPSGPEEMARVEIRNRWPTAANFLLEKIIRFRIYRLFLVLRVFACSFLYLLACFN